MTNVMSWQEHLRRLPYEEYLRTSHWKCVRSAALDAARNQCERCGDRQARLDVHHRTYTRLGGELLADVVVLCRRCHEEVHVVPGAIAEASITIGLLGGAVAAVLTAQHWETPEDEMA